MEKPYFVKKNIVYTVSRSQDKQLQRKEYAFIMEKSGC